MQKGHKPLNFFLNHLLVFAACLIKLLLAGCDFSENSNPTSHQKPTETVQASAQNHSPSQLLLLTEINNKADRLHDKAIADGRQLTVAIDHFIRNRSVQDLEHAKMSWLSAHGSLTTLMAIYQADKPRESLFGSSVPYSVHSLLDATPMLPGYLDAVPGYPTSGLISSLELPINIQTLVAKHQYADHEFVAFGLHPLEFFLWEKGDSLMLSQTASESTIEQGKSPARTKARDDVVKTLFPNQQPLNQRRKTFLRLVSQEYENQLVALKKRWHQNELAMAYLQKPEDYSQNHQPELHAIMLYLDSFITEQLMPTPDGNSYLFEQHYQYSGSATSHWKPVISGIEILLEIGGTFNESLQDLSTDLQICLLNIAVPADKLQSNPCQNEMLALKEKIILSFAQTVDK